MICQYHREKHCSKGETAAEANFSIYWFTLQGSFWLGEIVSHDVGVENQSRQSCGLGACPILSIICAILPAPSWYIDPAYLSRPKCYCWPPQAVRFNELLQCACCANLYLACSPVSYCHSILLVIGTWSLHHSLQQRSYCLMEVFLQSASCFYLYFDIFWCLLLVIP